MKKFITAVLGVALFLGSTVFAEGFEERDYSSMKNQALRIELPEEYVSQDLECTPSVYPQRFYSQAEGQSEDERIFNGLYAALSPENIVNQEVTYDSQNKLYLVYVTVQIDFRTGESVAEKREYINRIYNRFVVENPEYFYLVTEGFSAGISLIGGEWYAKIPAIICHDFPDFDGSKASLLGLKTKYDALTQKTDEIAEELYFDGMTDLDKLLLTHDYITDNCAYYLVADKNGNAYYGDGYSYNSYGAVINGQAVCQGYSLAYGAILAKLGYPIENLRYVLSNNVPGFNHIWNFVKLGEKWYHIDATWDDPTGADYDMNDKSRQRTYHDLFLISDATNTAIRNQQGCQGFKMEIYGYEELPGDLPSDTAYESGYIFNDPVNNYLQLIPGKIEYENGDYKKYYGNTIMYFNFENLETLPYMISQPGYNSDKELTVIILGAKQRTVVNEAGNMYICCYDKDERLINVEKRDIIINSFAQYPVQIEIATGTKKIKIITVKNGTVIPLANVPIVK